MKSSFKAGFLWACLLVMLVHPPVFCDEIREQVEKPVEQAISTRQKTQQQDEEWRQLQEQLVLKMEQLQASVDQLQVQKQGLVVSINASKTRIDEKKQVLAGISQIEEKMEPFLLQLVADIKMLPDNGFPYLIDERTERITKLENLLNDPEIESSEKYRKAMEALLVEMEYGLTIETYQQQIELENENILVNIFRLGTLGLYFQTLDQQNCGLYDLAEEKWIFLPDTYSYTIQKVIEIAAKRRPAELVSMPLGRLTEMVQQ